MEDSNFNIYLIGKSTLKIEKKSILKNAAIASRIIRDAIEAELIKEDDPMSKSRKYASYVPFWA